MKKGCIFCNITVYISVIFQLCYRLAETIVKKKIYNPDKEVKLILNKKAKRCMDKNAVVCCILGLTVSVILIVCICLLYKIVL
jgi:hypothetical protein